MRVQRPLASARRASNDRRLTSRAAARCASGSTAGVQCGRGVLLPTTRGDRDGGAYPRDDRGATQARSRAAHSWSVAPRAPVRYLRTMAYFRHTSALGCGVVIGGLALVVFACDAGV